MITEPSGILPSLAGQLLLRAAAAALRLAPASRRLLAKQVLPGPMHRVGADGQVRAPPGGGRWGRQGAGAAVQALELGIGARWDLKG